MKIKTGLPVAIGIAQQLLDLLAPHCERIEIAGSLRRGKPEIGDIDLLAIPIYEDLTDLVGDVVDRHPLLDALFAREHIPVAAQGQQSRKIVFRGLPADIFFADPATWAVRLAIRTGCADFSHWLVTRRAQGGALPSNCRIAGGRLYCDGQPVALAEEQDLFAAIGLPYIQPARRHRAYWNQHLAGPIQEDTRD